MSSRPSWILSVLVLSLVSCTSSSRVDGSQIREQFGRLVVDETPLEHRRGVAIQGELAGADAATLLRLATHTGPIDITGGPADTYEFLVTVESEVEGDGVVELIDGELRVRSTEGRAVAINGIRGRLPEGVALQVLAASGSVTLQDFRGSAKASIQAPVGKVELSECRFAELELNGSLGFAKLEDCELGATTIHLGTGSFQAVDSEIEDLEAATGTGDLQLSGCRVREARITSATGSLWLLASQIGHLAHSLGAGRLELRETLD